MKKIFWSETNISILSDNIEAKEHKHLMLHLFYKHDGEMRLSVNDDEIFGSCIVVESDVRHILPRNKDIVFFSSIDATTDLADQLRAQYLHGKAWAAVSIDKKKTAFENFTSKLTPDGCSEFMECLLHQLNIQPKAEKKPMDQRIEQLIGEINRFSHLESTTTLIAERHFLSESRLSHLFKKETGISLKSFLVLTKLKKAYKLLWMGQSITDAALESGFYSASHLADTNKRMMGMNITEALKDSRFLEA